MSSSQSALISLVAILSSSQWLTTAARTHSATAHTLVITHKTISVYGSTTNHVFRFTHTQLLGYFITRIAHDGLPAELTSLWPCHAMFRRSKSVRQHLHSSWLPARNEEKWSIQDWVAVGGIILRDICSSVWLSSWLRPSYKLQAYCSTMLCTGRVRKGDMNS